MKTNNLTSKPHNNKSNNYNNDNSHLSSQKLFQIIYWISFCLIVFDWKKCICNKYLRPAYYGYGWLLVTFLCVPTKKILNYVPD